MDSQSCDVLQQLDAPRLLIQASATPKAKSLFVKDQVCTLNLLQNLFIEVQHLRKSYCVYICLISLTLGFMIIFLKNIYTGKTFLKSISRFNEL